MSPTRILSLATATLALSAGSLAEARYYDATVSVWLSPDPAGMPDGPNRYEYVMDRPTAATDPSGTTIDLGIEAQNPIAWALAQEAIAESTTAQNLYSYMSGDSTIYYFVDWENASPTAKASGEEKIGVTYSDSPTCPTKEAMAVDVGSVQALGLDPTGGLVHEMRHAVDAIKYGMRGREDRAFATQVLAQEEIDNGYNDMGSDFGYVNRIVGTQGGVRLTVLNQLNLFRTQLTLP